MCHICDSPCRERSKVGLGTDRDEVWAILDYSNLKTFKTLDLIASWDYTPDPGRYLTAQIACITLSQRARSYSRFFHDRRVVNVSFNFSCVSNCLIRQSVVLSLGVTRFHMEELVINVFGSSYDADKTNIKRRPTPNARLQKWKRQMQHEKVSMKLHPVQVVRRRPSAS